MGGPVSPYQLPWRLRETVTVYWTRAHLHVLVHTLGRIRPWSCAVLPEAAAAKPFSVVRSSEWSWTLTPVCGGFCSGVACLVGGFRCDVILSRRGCGNQNFAWRTECNQCKAPKPEGFLPPPFPPPGRYPQLLGTKPLISSMSLVTSCPGSGWVQQAQP